MEETSQMIEVPNEIGLSEHCSTLPSGIHESEEHLRCPLCDQGMHSKSDLICHLTEAHKERLSAVCKSCGQYFSSDKIQLHAIRCKGSHVCPYCRSTFARRSYLQRHITRLHFSFTRPICDICGKSFSQTCALLLHKRTHNGEFPYACELCGAVFSQSCHVKFHLDSHHAYLELSNKPKPFQCDTCGRGFLFACSLQNHRKQHVAEPYVFSCNVCCRKFRFRSELERHQLSHLKKPMYSCTFCHQMFKRLSLLRAHLLRHTAPGFLTCHICLRSYASRAYLLEHIEKHRVNTHASSTSSFDSESAPDIDSIALPGDSDSTTTEAVLFDETLFEKCGDYTQSDPPNVNLLHDVLYGSGSCDQKDVIDHNDHK